MNRLKAEEVIENGSIPRMRGDEPLQQMDEKDEALYSSHARG